ncbi:hypothetical protein ACFQX6_52260 [Streptosporangium lutulentum]
MSERLSPTVATRERIIREVLRLFAEHGYARTSVADAGGWC